ncbi:MAG: hypothetical protein JEY99_04435 [Spirochaetales bacterium]|nr:hypothetical protein [Spirochaetales bacterium]
MKTRNLIIFSITLFILLSGVVFFFRFRQYGSDFKYYLIGFGIALLIIGGIFLSVWLDMRRDEKEHLE